MMKANLKSIEDSRQLVDQKIDELLLNFYAAMPSQGSYPFTMIRIFNQGVNGLTTEPVVFPKSRILILERTDFSLDDLISYVIHSKEYSGIRSDLQSDFLRDLMIKYRSPAALKIWKSQVTSLGIGIVIQLAKQKDLNIALADDDLAKPDLFPELNSNALRPYQLLDCSLIQ